MENNNSNKGLVIALIVICVLVGVGCFFIGKNVAKPELSTPSVSSEGNSQEDVSQVLNNQDEQNSLHVFKINNNNDYNLYSYLDNQGSAILLVDYKNNLYKITETGQASCVSKLYNGITFNNNRADCSVGSTFGEIYSFNVSTSDLSNAYVIQSHRSDGAEFVLLVFKNGKVSRYEFVDHGSVEEDYFNGIKVKAVKKFECSERDDNGCSKDKFTLVLQDNTTTTVEK